jgi:hypothetical protein
LLFSRDFTSEQEPEESLREGLLSAGCFGEELLAVLDGLATETDTFLCER